VKCDQCASHVQENKALYVTYDVDCVYMQAIFCSSLCKKIFELSEGVSEDG
jgi:hypothetical protein